MITPEEMQAHILRLMEKREAEKMAEIEQKLKRDRYERNIKNKCFAISAYCSMVVTPLVIAAVASVEREK